MIEIDWKKVDSLAHETRGFLLHFSHEVHRRRNKGSLAWPSHDKDLACWCAIASALLKSNLHAIGVSSRIRVGLFEAGDKADPEEYGENHTWLEVKGKYIDITASQFDNRLAGVYITDTDNEEYCIKYKLRPFKNWPYTQQPITNKLKLLRIEQKRYRGITA